MADILIKGMEMPTEGTVIAVYKIDGKLYATRGLSGKFYPLVPAANARPVVRGKWIKINGLTACSVCKGNPPRTYHNFCPNCGADMREETDV